MITPASTGLSPPAAGGVPYTFTEGRAFTGSWRGTSKDAHPTRAVKSRAQAVGDLATITVENDVRDMETLRAHFGFDRISLLGYSVYGMEVVLYAVEHPTLVQRVVQLGPVPLRFGTGYPRGLDNTADRSVFDEGLWQQLEALRAQRKDETEPREYCRSEMEFFGGSVMKLDVPWSRVTSGVTMPVLTIHGGKDRNAPYGAGREWASRLPGCSGKVGMYGFSYQGMAQIFAASTRPEALTAICPAMAAYDVFEDFAYEGGALRLVLLEALGKAIIRSDVPRSEVRASLVG